MPQPYARHVDGFSISPQSLACGLAAATRQAVITPDVTADPRWRSLLLLAKEFDYRACWSFPIEAPSGKIVGTFAMYYKEPTERVGCINRTDLRYVGRDGPRVGTTGGRARRHRQSIRGTSVL